MTENEKAINTFATRVRQMILQYKELKLKNEKLHAEIEKRDAEIASLQGQLKQAALDYQSLKMARMLEISDTEVEGAQKRIARLIRDVNKCITLLGE